MKRSHCLFAALAVIVGSAISGELMPQAHAAAGKDRHHINIMAFYRVSGAQFQFPDEVKGYDVDVIKAFYGKAYPIFLTHTAGLLNGDVLMINNDVLRDKGSGFSDNGIDCQFSVNLKGEGGAHAEADHGIGFGGMCKVQLMDGKGKEISTRAVIKPTMIPDTAHVASKFKAIYIDQAVGVAIYANGEEEK